MLPIGIYEQVINKTLASQLKLEKDKLQDIAPIDKAEASSILSSYLAEVIERALCLVKDSGGDIHTQVNLANKLVELLFQETLENSLIEFLVDKRAEQLLAVIQKKNTLHAINEKVGIIRPETSIARSSLFTGASREPSMHTELKKEILTADKIEMLVAFIKWSGLRILIDELQTFTQQGGTLRIITTSYMGATETKAIEELRKLPNTEIKVSYHTKSTRLHAKSYIFYRKTGFTTAYVGSSNLSNAAISSGLEWNVKVTAKDLPETINKIEATFNSYWNSSEFELYGEGSVEKLVRALKAEKYTNDHGLSFQFDIAPYAYQQEILDKLDAERKVRAHFKNLVVAATGTGKTVIAAFDYKRFCGENHNKNRLLFVAHREEILKQSIDCFRGVLKDQNFGDLFVGTYKPESLDHLFISIQTFNSQKFCKITSRDAYDFIIVDEFHHAAAKSYQELLTYYEPRILLGLTATPERMDGKGVLEYFDNRIAAEIRLPEAIDRKLLCPFQYFGVTDTIDLDTLTWSRGGYDKNELSRVYTMEGLAARRRAEMIIRSILHYVNDIVQVKGLGFCVSIEHAKFMTEFFNNKGIPSMFLTSESPYEDRRSAKDSLVQGKVRFIFVVDLFNEGVDIQQINTVLFLRPTESLTVFLQQLGRGLRLWEGKECLTVLDFIGQANNRYNFEDKFTALLSNTERSLQKEIAEGFISVPKGCYIQLEKKAREYILSNIRNSFGNKAGLVSRMVTFTEDTGKTLTLMNFVKYYHLDVRAVYKCASFSRLLVLAGKRDDFNESMEELMTKSFLRICAIDSRRWLSFLLRVLPNIDQVSIKDLEENERRMLEMLWYTIWQEKYEKYGYKTMLEGFVQLKENPVMFIELIELLEFNFEAIDFIDQPVDLGFDCPLDLHCSYTMRQLMTALDYTNFGAMRGVGVKYLPDKKLDVFFITLNKSEKYYSPTTLYDDYSINETLFHWQSQSTTSEDSATGKRYINHKKCGSKIALFVRDNKKDMAGTSPYTFLGLADYITHEGSKPMSITWKLHKPIPAKYLKKTNKLIVG